MKELQEIARQRFVALSKRFRSDRELASAIGTSPSQLSQYKNGNRQIGERFAEKVEKALDLSPGYFFNPINVELENSSILDISNAGHKAKLISWERVVSTLSGEEEHNDKGLTMIFVGRKVSASAFVIACRGDSMFDAATGKGFNEGRLLVFEPGQSADHGKFVLVLQSGASDPVFRRLQIEGKRCLLVPLNPRYSIDEMSNNDTILAVLVRSIIIEDFDAV